MTPELNPRAILMAGSNHACCCWPQLASGAPPRRLAEPRRVRMDWLCQVIFPHSGGASRPSSTRDARNILKRQRPTSSCHTRAQRATDQGTSSYEKQKYIPTVLPLVSHRSVVGLPSDAHGSSMVGNPWDSHGAPTGLLPLWVSYAASVGS